MKHDSYWDRRLLKTLSYHVPVKHHRPMSVPEILLWISLAAFFVAMTLYAPMGCQHVSAQAQQQISQLHDQTALKVAQVKDAGKVNDAKSTASPSAHLIHTTTMTIKEQRSILKPVAFISFIALLFAFGVSFTALSWLSKIILPIAGAIFAGAEIGIFALPLVPWIIGACIAAAAALVIYEIVRAHGNVSQAVADLKTDLETVKSIAGLKPQAGTLTAPIVVIHPDGSTTNK